MLEDQSGTTVLTGRIITRIHRYADGPWKATALLGILAAVAQLLSLWRNSDTNSMRKVVHDKEKTTGT